MDPLRKALDEPGNADLVDHLGELAGPDRPHQSDHAGIGLDHRLGAIEDGLVAAAHDREDAILRACLAAGDGCVDEVDALGLGGVGKLAGDFGAGSGIVDQNGASLHAGSGAGVSERDGAEVIIIADAGEDEVGVPGGFGGSGGGAPTMFLRPFLRLGSGAVVDSDVVAALFLEMPGHRETHYAQTDE